LANSLLPVISSLISDTLFNNYAFYSVFFPIFEASNKLYDMKKFALFSFVIALFSVFCSCGNGHSKAYLGLEKNELNIEGQIMETANCDDLQMLSFSILGFRSDLENAFRDLSVTEKEAEELTKMADHLDVVWQSKSSSLGCESFDADAEELITSEEDDYNIL